MKRILTTAAVWLLAATCAWAGAVPAPPAALAPLYVGQLATRGQVANTFSAGATKAMYRSVHFARDNITSAQLVLGNWYVSGSTFSTIVEAGTGGTATVTASIEYPAGTFTQMLFTGSATASIASGATAVSDAAAVVIPRGAQFWVRQYWVNASGVISNFPGGVPGATNLGDTTVFGAGASDQTMSGTVANSNAGFFLTPLAIVGPTRRPSGCLAGDSVQYGINEAVSNMAVTADGNQGVTARSVGAAYGYIQSGKPSEAGFKALLSFTRRQSLFQYCSFIVDQYGINDYFNGQTAAQIATTHTSFAALFPGKAVYGATLPPHTTSTDSWATAGNQTVTANESIRTGFNALVRAGIPGEANYIDLADFFETNRNSGIWVTDGVANDWTTDGTHPQFMPSQKLQQSNTVSSGLFSR